MPFELLPAWLHNLAGCVERTAGHASVWIAERVLFIGTQFSILYTFVYSPA